MDESDGPDSWAQTLAKAGAVGGLALWPLITFFGSLFGAFNGFLHGSVMEGVKQVMFLGLLMGGIGLAVGAVAGFVLGAFVDLVIGDRNE